MVDIPRLCSRLLVCLCTIGCVSPCTGKQSDAPQITAVEPKAGITTPGIRVKVYGSAFSSQAQVYFDGLQVRETRYISPTSLEVVTPYLRPGPHQLQLKSGDIIVRSEVSFAALAAHIDSEIDRAVKLAGQGETPTAIAILTSIAKTDSDYQVRAFAYYQIGQIYFSLGDWWRWAGVPIFLDSDKAGPAVQTFWQYRLSEDQSTYLLPVDSDPDTPLKLADWTVKYDVTENPEPRFFRALVNARYGNVQTAKTDSEFILAKEPNNLSYRALAAYIAVLSGDMTGLRSFSDQAITDARALSLLGEAAYLSGDSTKARVWWGQAERIYPLGASLAYWAGKKHMARGQQRIAESLFMECTVMAPESKEGKEARELLAQLQGPTS